MNLFRSKAQNMWIRSLLLLIGILLLVVTLLTSWVIKSFSKEITRLNYNLTSLVQESIDIRLKEIESIASQIELSAAHLKLSKMTDTTEIDSLAYPFGNQVRNYELANRFIENIYIYYPNIDYVIGDVGNFPSRNYYLLNNGLDHDGYNEWNRSLIDRANKNYSFKNETLQFSRQLPNNDFAKVTATITIEIKREEILKVLESSMRAGTDSITALLSSENNLYASAGNDSKYVINGLPAETFSGESLITYKNYFVLKRDSLIRGLKYITIIDRSEFLLLAHNIRNTTYLVLLGCLVLGVYMSIYVSKRNYKPLSSIVNKMKAAEGEAKAGPERIIDEYNLIGNKVDSILFERTKSNLRLEEQQILIEGLFLTHVLSSEQRNSHTIFASMKRLDLEFLYPQFAVMLIRAKGPSNAKENGEEFQKQINLLHEVYKDFYFISAEYQEDLVLLFNVDSEVTMTVLKDIAIEYQSKPSEFPDSIIALGVMYDSLPDIVKSYHQACQAADLNQESSGGVFVYDPQSLHSMSAEKYSSGVMTEFNQYMDEQRYDEAQKLIDVLFNKFVVQEENAYLSRCNKYAIVNRVIAGVRKVALQNKSMEVDDYIGLLSDSDSLAELRKSVHEVMNLIRDKFTQSAVKQSANVAQHALEIIEKEYTDPMLGLYSISERLGVTNTYLSKVFKDTYGQGLTQYINLQRIERAKTLILTTSLSVKEITVRVGFTSDVSFIRVFKQYTNTTPGKFKNK